MNWIYSPFIIPLAGISVAIVAIISGAVSQMHNSRLKAEQRMAMLARGIPMAEIEAVLQSATVADAPQPKDPLRSLGNARRTAMVLIPIGLGLTIFFLIFGAIALRHINTTAGWSLIACSATGLIPLAIGIGFLIDYRMQMREMARFGLEIDAQAHRP
jgi:hypothetical protein